VAAAGAAQEQGEPHQVQQQVGGHREGRSAGQHDLRRPDEAEHDHALGGAVVGPQPRRDAPQHHAGKAGLQWRDQRQRHDQAEVATQRGIDRQVVGYPALAIAHLLDEQVVERAVVGAHGRGKRPDRMARAENHRIEHRHVFIAGEIVIEQHPGADQPEQGHQRCGTTDHQPGAQGR
jgi:hypothetical protein